MRNTTKCVKQKKRKQRNEQNAIERAWEYLMLVLNMVTNIDNLF